MSRHMLLIVQSVTIPEGGTVSQIRFNWFTYKNGADQAARNQSPTAFGRVSLSDSRGTDNGLRAKHKSGTSRRS